MGRPLPLSALRAFAAVGRCGSVKGAAEVLGVTPGAVSQQVRALEERLQVLLFERGNRTIGLTKAGRRLHGPISEAFDRIEDAVAGLERQQSRRREVVTVSTVGSFAATWLVPRLGRFAARYPRIDVRILATPELVPIGTRAGGADVGIRHGLGRYPGLEALPLLRPRLLPVGSPALLAGGSQVRSPADCLRYPLLQDVDGGDWSLWLRAQGVEDPRGLASVGPSFSDDHLLVRAAVAGQGLALVRDTYAADEIAAGRLAVALDVSWPTPFAYYLVTRPGAAAGTPRIAAFRDWLLEEAAIA